MPFLENASQLLINGGVFTEVTTNNHFVPASSSNDPLASLLQRCAMEATHESSSAAYAPKCKPGTREKVIGDIMSWVDHRDKPSIPPVLWFSGPAGGGKTCIQREVARLSQAEGTLAASYFFSTRVANLDNSQPFVLTIVQQLIEKIAPLKPLVVQAIQSTPSIFNKGLEAQVETLLLNPFKSLAGNKHTRKLLEEAGRLITIDGFDECRREDQREELLHVIHLLATNSHLPFRVILASRPEFDIRTAFTTDPLLSLTQTIRLENYDGDDDIRRFICDEFNQIRKTHPSKHSIPSSWPPEEEIQTVVTKSSSQFIFAATVVKYVGSRHHNPVNSLRRVLDLSEPTISDSRNPFAELDQLYGLILHPANVDLQILRRLLHFTGRRCDSPPEGDLPFDLLDEFFGLELGTAGITLCDLHSVISIHDATGRTSFHHKSLQDYIYTPSRGGDMYQSAEEANLDIAMRCVFHLKNWSNGTSESQVINPILFYSATCVFYHLLKPTLGGHEGSPSHNLLLELNPAIPCQVEFIEGMELGYHRRRSPYHPYATLKTLAGDLHERMCIHIRDADAALPDCAPICKRFRYLTLHEARIREIFDMGIRTDTREARFHHLPRLNVYLQWLENRDPCEIQSGIDLPARCIAVHKPKHQDRMKKIPIPPVVYSGPYHPVHSQGLPSSFDALGGIPPPKALHWISQAWRAATCR